MKKTLSLALAILLVAVLAACGGGGAPVGSNKDYAELLTELRSEDENVVYPPITSPDDDRFGVLDLVGVNPEDMQRYAIAASMNIVNVYGVAIILPAEGKAESIKKSLEAFVQAMKNSMENYLPNQYEIANTAIIREADTGEIVLVMCADATILMDNILKGLKG